MSEWIRAEARGLVVVGASLAGLRAVEAARRSGYAGPVTLIGAENHPPYDRPPLSKAYLDAPAVPDVSYRGSLDDLRVDLGVDLRLGTPATGFDPDARVVQVDGAEVPFESLVIATGARARTLATVAGPGVHALRTLDDARAVRSALEAGAATTIVGAGFIGSEVASAARKRGLPVTILEATPAPLERAVGEEMGRELAGLHEVNGTVLRTGVTVAERPATDLVVVGVGAVPATEWLAGSGLALDDGVVCDASMRTSLPGIYVAGDVARWHNPRFDRSMRLEHWTSAAEQAAVAARNAVLGTSESYSTVPYFWSDWYGVRIQFVGICDADEVLVVTGQPEEGRWVAAYRTGDRLTGAFCVGYPSRTMKYRRLIAAGASWSEALDFARAA